MQGCASSFAPEHPLLMATAKTNIHQGYSQQPLPLDQESNLLLYAQEMGRLEQLTGAFTQSQRHYQRAIELYQQQWQRATLSATEIAQQTAAVIINDLAISYGGNPFEQLMLHQYQGMNYLFQGNLEAAMVEARQVNQLQQMQLQQYQGEHSVAALESGEIQKQLSQLSRNAGNHGSSLVNSYNYVFSALLHDISGNANAAYIDIKKAHQLSPNNPQLKSWLAELAQKAELEMPQGFIGAPASKGQGTLVLLGEQGWIQAKKAINIPFWIDRKWYRLSMPSYGRSYPPAPLKLTLDSIPLSNNRVNQLDKLAITALKEQYIAIAARQIARIYAKVKVNESMEYEARGLELAVEIFNLISERADLRSWLTLPQGTSLTRKHISAGKHQLNINGQLKQLEIKPGRTTIVWAIKVDNKLKIHSIII
ncbi:hypothetical protein [Paraferrimonas sp. SM1919]|uniref:hypothetical protein n=1 Tax=Paraferrimonas sp. SM1919 TaxID=2662263 RepID=UPI001969B6AC|nr:hypothetical protein [Paraferrimonas sp. SM1919]